LPPHGFSESKNHVKRDSQTSATKGGNPDGIRHYVGKPFHLLDTTNLKIMSKMVHNLE